jgi:hypothetical protein
VIDSLMLMSHGGSKAVSSYDGLALGADNSCGKQGRVLPTGSLRMRLSAEIALAAKPSSEGRGRHSLAGSGVRPERQTAPPTWAHIAAFARSTQGRRPQYSSGAEATHLALAAQATSAKAMDGISDSLQSAGVWW